MIYHCHLGKNEKSIIFRYQTIDRRNFTQHGLPSEEEYSAKGKLCYNATGNLEMYDMRSNASKIELGGGIVMRVNSKHTGNQKLTKPQTKTKQNNEEDYDFILHKEGEFGRKEIGFQDPEIGETIAKGILNAHSHVALMEQMIWKNSAAST